MSALNTLTCHFVLITVIRYKGIFDVRNYQGHDYFSLN